MHEFNVGLLANFYSSVCYKDTYCEQSWNKTSIAVFARP